MQAKETVPGPHARTPAPAARGPRTPTARPEGGQPGEDERLTSDAPYHGPRHPSQRGSPATPTAPNAASQERTPWGWCWAPKPALLAPGTHRQRVLAARRESRAAGRGKAPETRRSPQQSEVSPPGRPPTAPTARSPPQTMQADGTVQGSHARTLSPAAPGPRTPTACPEGRQPG